MMHKIYLGCIAFLFAGFASFAAAARIPEIRAVEYRRAAPGCGCAAEGPSVDWDISLIRSMGANAVVVDALEIDGKLVDACARHGVKILRDDDASLSSFARSEGFRGSFFQREIPLVSKYDAKSEWIPMEGATAANIAWYSSAASAKGVVAGPMFDRDGDERGLVSANHLVKKDVFRFYQVNWTDEKLLHICGKLAHVTHSNRVDVTAFSSVGEVSLLVNGRLIARKTPDAFKTVKFTDVPLEPGRNDVLAKSGDWEMQTLWEYDENWRRDERTPAVPVYKNRVIEPSFDASAIKAPEFPARDFDIRRFGAKPDGSKCTAAFAKAMAECSSAGGGRVVVPAGVWVTGPIHFRSGCNLHLEEGSMIVFTDDVADYLPAVRTSWEGVECYNYSPLLYAYGVTNIAVTGRGILSPRMAKWREWFSRPKAHLDARDRLYAWGITNAPVSKRVLTAIPGANNRPHLIHFNRARNVLLDGFFIRESPFWTIHLFHSDNCTVRNLHTSCHGHNNDGVDVEMTKNVLIENCDFDQGDDGIALKAGRNGDGWRLGRPTANVIVRNCRFDFAHSLLAVGSELSGGVENVLVYDSFINSCDHVVSFKTNRRRGGFMRDIRIENVASLGNVRWDAVRLRTDAFLEPRMPETPERRTEISRLFVKGLDCGSAASAVKLTGDAALPAKSITVSDVWTERLRLGFTEVENCPGAELKNVRCQWWPGIGRDVKMKDRTVAFRPPNFDSTKIAPYVLEDPLAFPGGGRVASAQDWQTRRRGILDTFAREMYGEEPPPPEALVTELVDERVALAGFAVRRLYRMSFKKDGSGPAVNWIVWQPRYAKEKSPVMLFLNRSGNQELVADADLPGRTGFRDHPGRMQDTENPTVFPVGVLIARGYAVMSACYREVAPDDPRDPWRGVFALWGGAGGRTENSPTSPGAWAWALSRGLDLAERIDGIDARRSVVTGCSRRAKAALLAAARDTRFALCVPVQAGGGGIKIAKRDFGENVSTQNRMFPHWFKPSYAKYAACPEKTLGFDQHLLAAAVAPRGLLVLGFSPAQWFDTEGEFISLKAAGPVWEFLCGEGLPDVGWPAPYDTEAVGKKIGYIRRTGAHGIAACDWMWMADFADRLFR